jgi:hypothetical protein
LLVESAENGGSSHPIAIVASYVENYGTLSQGRLVSIYGPTVDFSVVSGGEYESIQTGAAILDFPTSEPTGFYLRHNQHRFNVFCRNQPLADNLRASWSGTHGTPGTSRSPIRRALASRGRSSRSTGRSHSFPATRRTVISWASSSKQRAMPRRPNSRTIWPGL